MRKLASVYELTRFREYYGTVLCLSLLGILFQSSPSLKNIAFIVVANFLSSMFVYMINDANDWQDDLRDPHKKIRNPVSAGRINPKLAFTLSYSTAVLSLLAYYSAGYYPFLVGTLGIILGWLYSHKSIRLKSVPIADVATHGYFLGMVYFLSMIAGGNRPSHLYPAILVSIIIFGISIIGDFENEVRDFKADKQAGIRNTVQTLNLKTESKMLSKACIGLGVMMFIVIFLSIANPGKIILSLFSLALAIHYILFTRRNNTHLYSYSYHQESLTIVSLLFVIVRIVS